MEFVPFEFSLSVCEILKNLGELELLCRNNPDCDFWNNAIGKNIEKRPKFTFYFGCSLQGDWLYSIDCSPGGDVTLASFKAMSAQQNYHLEKIMFGPCSTLIRFIGIEKTIKKAAEYTASYMYKTEFEITNTAFPHELFIDILAVYRDRRSLGKINIIDMHDMYTSPMEDFLRAQLKSDHLKEFQVSLRCSRALRSSIEEFALKGAYDNLEIPETFFSFQFFQKLFRKRLFNDNKCSFVGSFIVWKDLRRFEPESLVSFGNSEAVWRRADGVTVTIQRGYQTMPSLCLITLVQ